VGGTDGNLFPLYTSTAFKPAFEESINKRPQLNRVVSKSLYNRADIITKYQILFLRENFCEFIVAIAKETSFSISVEKIPPL
jgi:hypothetical protein